MTYLVALLVLIAYVFVTAAAVRMVLSDGYGRRTPPSSHRVDIDFLPPTRRL